MVSTLAWILGLTAAIMNTSGLIPQVIKGFKTKSVKDLSWSWIGMAGGGTFLWLAYSLIVSDPVLLLANSITGICYGFILFQKIKY